MQNHFFYFQENTNQNLKSLPTTPTEMSSTSDEAFSTSGSDDVKDAPVRVFLWSLPRTCSTVLLKCMSFVDHCAVWMEPYNMCYSNSAHFNPDYLKDDPDMKVYRKRLAPYSESLEMQKLRKDIAHKASTLPNLWDNSDFT